MKQVFILFLLSVSFFIYPQQEFSNAIELEVFFCNFSNTIEKLSAIKISDAYTADMKNLSKTLKEVGDFLTKHNQKEIILKPVLLYYGTDKIPTKKNHPDEFYLFDFSSLMMKYVTDLDMYSNIDLITIIKTLTRFNQILEEYQDVDVILYPVFSNEETLIEKGRASYLNNS